MKTLVLNVTCITVQYTRMHTTARKVENALLEFVAPAVYGNGN